MARGYTQPQGFVSFYMATRGNIGVGAERLIQEIRESPYRYSLSKDGFLDDEEPRDCKAKRRTDLSSRWVPCASKKVETKEKGVDVALALDLALGACLPSHPTAYDLAFLVSIDRDFLPAIEFAKRAGKTILNAFPKRGHIAKACEEWGPFIPIDIGKLLKMPVT